MRYTSRGTRTVERSSSRRMHSLFSTARYCCESPRCAGRIFPRDFRFSHPPHFSLPITSPLIGKSSLPRFLPRRRQENTFSRPRLVSACILPTPMPTVACVRLHFELSHAGTQLRLGPSAARIQHLP